MQSAATLAERSWNVSRLSAAWRFLTVAALLIAMNCIVADGGLWLFRQIRPSGRFLMYLSLGWPGVEWALLAFWLTWGPSSFVGRLILVLVAVAARSCSNFLWNLDSGLEFGFAFVWALTISYTMVLGAHGLMLPARDSVSWRIVGRGHEELVARRLQWSVRQLLTWTTFLAIPLALAQLTGTLLTLADPNPRFWVAVSSEAAIGLLGTGAVGIGVLAERMSWLKRLALIATAPPVLLALRLVYAGFYSYPERINDSLWWSAGLSTAALVNMLILRWCGLRWKRAAAPSSDVISMQSQPALVGKS